MDEVLDSYNPLGKYKINVYNLEGTHTDTHTHTHLGPKAFTSKHVYFIVTIYGSE